MGSSQQVAQPAQALSLPTAPLPSRQRSQPTARRGRHRDRGVALFGVSLLVAMAGVAACGSSTNTTAPPVPGSATSSASSTDGGARLAAVLAQLGGGYSFDTNVSVGGQVATEAKGRWVGGNSEFTVSTNGVAITYRTLPPRSWVLQSSAGWVEVNGSVPSGSPLDAFKTPGQSTVVAQTAAMVELTATYPASVLGLAGSHAVAVDLVLATDGTLKAAYSAPDGTATAATTITPDPSQSPIIAPSPS